MEKEDNNHSRPSPKDSLSPDPPIGLKTTVKSPDRESLALVVSPINQTASGVGHGKSSGGGGGRDDCWSEDATEILIDAWGGRYLELNRGNLKQQHWKEVAEIVNREKRTSPKTDVQCKNRIDTVKKKFKQEKAKIAAGDNSKWIFFKKLQLLIGAATTTASKALMVTPLSTRSNFHHRQAKSSTAQQGAARWHFRKRIASESESESEPNLSTDSGDSPPPPPMKLSKTGEGRGTEVREVAMAILGFAESYEKAETLKLKQMVELEKERMEFAKELDLQRMQFFKTHLDMLQKSLEEHGDTLE